VAGHWEGGIVGMNQVIPLALDSRADMLHLTTRIHRISPWPDAENPTGGSPSDVRPVSITDEMKRSYLDYAMSVIVSRALPDVRDGLKPVHRASSIRCTSRATRPTRNTSNRRAWSAT
jgi:hypothetical protein